MATINTDIAQTTDIIARSNNSFNLKININNSSGGDFDLTGYKVYFEIKAAATSVLLRGLTNDTSSEYTSNNLYSTTAVSIADGTITMAESADNMNITKGVYKYTLKLKSSEGQLKTWMLGKFKINDD